MKSNSEKKIRKYNCHNGIKKEIGNKITSEFQNRKFKIRERFSKVPVRKIKIETEFQKKQNRIYKFQNGSRISETANRNTEIEILTIQFGNAKPVYPDPKKPKPKIKFPIRKFKAPGQSSKIPNRKCKILKSESRNPKKAERGSKFRNPKCNIPKPKIKNPIRNDNFQIRKFKIRERISKVAISEI